jgi:opacity protein-like surface antigen
VTGRTTLLTSSLFAIVLLFSGASAHAQDIRGFVGGQFGATFGTEAAPFFAGEVGANVTRDLQIYGTVGRMNNVLPSSIQDDLDAAAAVISILYRASVDLDATAPAFFGIGGVRYLVPTGTAARPYALGGVGFSSVTVNAKVAVNGVTLDLAEAGYLDDERFNKLAFEFGGGVFVPFGRTYLDVGYRFMKLVDAEDINISRAYAGFGVTF